MKNHIHSLTLVILGVLLAPAAFAGPIEDVAVATTNWGEVLAQQNPDTITALYAENGVLWGTISPTVRSGPDGIRAYFVSAFAALPQIKVSFGDQKIRVFGNTAVNTGYYTFSFTKDGETKSIPARYSFTYVKDGDKWMIVDHHSSVMPPAPR
jgi:uncharacterized protein (TIGR02246 family)